MAYVVGFFIFLIISAIIVAINNNANKDNSQKQLKEKIENFDSLIHFNIDDSTLPSISIDKDNYIIYQYSYKDFLLNDIKKRNIKDIIRCEMLADSEIIQTTNRGSQLAGAIIGGAVFGPVGAIVGGVTGKKTNKKQNKSYEIRIYYTTPESPLDVIKLENDPKKSTNLSQNIEDTALKIYATIESLINLERQKNQQQI